MQVQLCGFDVCQEQCYMMISGEESPSIGKETKAIPCTTSKSPMQQKAKMQVSIKQPVKYENNHCQLNSIVCLGT